MSRWPPSSPTSSPPPIARPRRRAGSPSATRSPTCLRGAAPDEVEIAVAWLSGEARQGRIGVGWATLGALRGTPAAEARADAGRGRRRARRRRGHRRQGLGRGAQRHPARPVRSRHRRRAGLPRPPAHRRTAPGRARRRDARRGRRGRRHAGRRRAPRGDGHRPPRRRSRGWRFRKAKAARASHASPWPCTGRCSRCSRRRPTTSPPRWRSSARRRSNGRSTARACRCTRRAARSRSTRAR